MTTSRWPGWTTKSRPFRKNGSATRRSSASCSAAAAAGDKPLTGELLGELDDWRDDFDRKIDTARSEMRRLAGAAIVGTRAYQQRVVAIGVALLAIAALLGLTVAAAVTLGLVRPVRRLLLGTAAVEHGALDTVVPVTSRDEIGSLTQSFNSMVGELRVKAQIRDTFGKYVDPRIVAGLLDRPELTDAKGSRREMTILFCDMKEFTALSEGMTPAALVNVLNRYMTVMSEPVRRNNGIIDKYIGDGIMAFWGPPFTGADDHSGLACLAALDQLAGLAGIPRRAARNHRSQARLSRDRYPHRHRHRRCGGGQHRLGTDAQLHGDRRYRQFGLAPRGGQQDLRHARARQRRNQPFRRRFGGDPRDRLRSWSSARPSRNASSKCSVARAKSVGERLALRDAFVAALAAYRRKNWEEARAGFEGCLEIVPGDGPSTAFLRRIAQFCTAAPGPDWDGVWSLAEK